MTTRVEHEVQIHYQLKHPAILELYTFFEDKHYVYLVLEMCTNGEMQRYLKSRCKSFDEEETRHFMKQIVDGMIYLHSHSILHRDLTLSNLLLTKDMNIKIADFGLATQINTPDEKHFTMCGTPNFISPEIASRNAHGLEADVWSLGCMMYTFLTGKPPFDTEGIRNTLNKVVLAEFEMPKYLSPEAQDLISCLLKKNPMDRIPLTKVREHPFMTNAIRSQQQQQHKMIPTSLLPSPASNSFKPINSFNESIDSGRGTMTTTNTSSSATQRSSQQQPQVIGRNLPTLQSGQEQDFNTVNSAINLINQMNGNASTSFLANNPHTSGLHSSTGNMNTTNSKGASLSSSSSSSSSSQSSYNNTNMNPNHHHTNSHHHHNNNNHHTNSQPIHHTMNQAPVDLADSSKNLYYNRFLKQQLDQNAPPSPPVKLSSYSPTKQQKHQLMSASTTSLSVAGSSNMGNTQQNYQLYQNSNTYQQLSRSNSNLASINTMNTNNNSPGNNINNLSSQFSSLNTNKFQHQQQHMPYSNSSPQCVNYNGKKKLFFNCFLLDPEKQRNLLIILSNFRCGLSYTRA